MKPTMMSLAKIYVASFGLAYYEHFAPLVGIGETLIGAPSYPSSWSWHAILLLTYIVLPIAAVFVDNYASYMITAAVATIGILAEVFGVFVWTTSSYLVILPLSALAVVISSILAVEDVASKVSGEILQLRWSQF